MGVGERDSAVVVARRIWFGIAIAVAAMVLVCGVPTAGVLVGISTAMAVAAALLRPARFSVVVLPAVASVVSLLVDLVQPADPLVAVWIPVEMAALMGMLVLVIRRAPARLGAFFGVLVGLAIVALPLRFTARMAESALEGSVLSVSVSLFAIACVGPIGLYLRSIDARRVRAVLEARRSQRLDLARDLHDFVAHEVTGIVVEAQSAQVADLDRVESREMFARIEQAGLRALSSMDQTVHALREPGGLADLPAVVERFSGVDLRLDTMSLASEVDSMAYRIVVEALTNVRRHASSATHVEVAVVKRADTVAISVTDNGGAARIPRPGGGSGLAGLDRQVRTLGGTFQAGPHGAGWRVHCVLPRLSL